MEAREIMTQRVVAARPDDTVADVAKLLSENCISAVPVCDPDGRLLGMISEGDLMRPFGQENATKRAWWLNMLAEGTELASGFVDYLRLDQHRARDLMSSPAVTATEAANIGEVADLLFRHKIKRVPIVRDGKVVGVVSRADLIHTLARSPQAFDDLSLVATRAGGNAPAPDLRHVAPKSTAGRPSSS